MHRFTVNSKCVMHVSNASLLRVVKAMQHLTEILDQDTTLGSLTIDSRCLQCMFHRQSHTLPGLLRSQAVLPNLNTCVPSREAVSTTFTRP